MDFRYLIVETRESICRITINRPERLNAINIRVGCEILKALEDCEKNEAVRVVVLTGAGRAFCAGDDLKGMTEPGQAGPKYPESVDYYVGGDGRWPLIVERMRALGKPIIAMINGHAHGAGFNLALGSDLRIMADTATLCIPFVKRGIATGTSLLQQYVGIGKAMEWALLAPQLTAQMAERWGLVNSVVELEKLESATMELARKLSKGPTRTYGITKAAIVESWQDAPEQAYRKQGRAYLLARTTEDFEEGRAAFLQKRSPTFVGR